MQQRVWSESIASALLRKHGLRVTAPRVAICMKLLEKHCHYTAQQLHAELVPKHPALSPNTVYLTLNQLAAVGVIRSFRMTGNTIFDSNISEHDHALCRECGRLEDLPSETLNTPTSPACIREWVLEGGTRLWSGFCPTCNESENKTA